MIGLASSDNISEEDIALLISWLRGRPRLTQGEKILELERRMAEFVGVGRAVFVNSGSSANLLMFSAGLESGLLRPHDRVVVPILSWITDLSPVVQLGLAPVFCDCELRTLSLDLNRLEDIFRKEKPRAVLLVHIMGFLPDMGEVRSLCGRYGVLLFEDACEAVGSSWKGERAGSFGLLGTYSTFYGHQMTTIEGGFVFTDDRRLGDRLLLGRAHGWDRDLSNFSRESLRGDWRIDEFQGLYTFYQLGFNFRGTEIQGVLGMSQLDRFPRRISRRHSRYMLYDRYLRLPEKVQSPSEDSVVSCFGYPVLVPDRASVVKRLNEHGVEIRPILGGSLARQPAFSRFGVDPGDYPAAGRVSDMGLYVPCHPDLTEQEIMKVCALLEGEEVG